MENSGWHHFNQGIKVIKVTSNNNIDITYPLTWRVHYCFSPQSNYDKTPGNPTLRDSIQSPTEMPGLEPRAHALYTLVQERYGSQGYGGVSFLSGMYSLHCWLDIHSPHCSGLTTSVCSVARIHISLPEGFLQSMKVVLFVLARDQNTLPPFLCGPQSMTERSRCIDIPVPFLIWQGLEGRSNTVACSTLAPRVPLWDWALIAHW